MKVKVNEIIEVYTDIAKHIRNKRKIHMFERNKMQNILMIQNWLDTGYEGGYYHIFMITDPKYRIIMSLNMNDKIINHYITKKVLIPKLDKYLDKRNVATRKGLGSDYGIKLIKRYIEEHKKYDKFYILKIDISKYFYSIDHEVLKGMLRESLDKEEMEIVEKIIDSTNKNYINERINKLIDKEKKRIGKNERIIEELEKIPRYLRGKGLPIGNMTSQFLSIYYLNKLDHYIIHDLHLKAYVRYMDDFIIINKDRKYLEECKKKIENKLEQEYKLKVNKKKTEIKRSREGFDFLGYHFRVKDNKTIVKVRKETIKRIKRNIKKGQNEYKRGYRDLCSYFSSINTYLYSFKYGSYSKRKRIVNKCIRDMNL